MKLVAVPILMLLLITQTFSKWAVILNYRINKEYIAKKLCENRARPQLHCNGQCVLMKKMKAAESEDNSPMSNQPLKVKLIELLFVTGKEQETAKEGFAIDSKIFNSRYLITEYTSHLSAVFHPPAIS